MQLKVSTYNTNVFAIVVPVVRFNCFLSVLIEKAMIINITTCRTFYSNAFQQYY